MTYLLIKINIKLVKLIKNIKISNEILILYKNLIHFLNNIKSMFNMHVDMTIDRDSRELYVRIILSCLQFFFNYKLSVLCTMP
jgi:hypothetical protein